MIIIKQASIWWEQHAMVRLIATTAIIITSGIIWCAMMSVTLAILATTESPEQKYVPKSKRKWNIGPMIDWINKRFDDGATYLGSIMSLTRGS
jgi:hypothetical protein